MTTVVRATIKDTDLLTKLGRETFFESHGLSASIKDIDEYVNLKFNTEVFEQELSDSKNHFYILYYKELPVGYSKIIFNFSHQNITSKNVTKLERLYVLKMFHKLKLGLELFHFNIQESKRNNQSGMWLHVWTENLKAINFYEKAGFKIIGNYDFKISKTHYNPNHHMLLTY